MTRIKNVRNNKKKKFSFQKEHNNTIYKNTKIELSIGRCTYFDDCPMSKTHRYGFKYVVKGGQPMYGTRDAPYKLGKTASVLLPLKMCENGIHYSESVSDAVMNVPGYLKSKDLRIYQVVGCGEHIVNNTKSCSQHVHFGKMIDKKTSDELGTGVFSVTYPFSKRFERHYRGTIKTIDLQKNNDDLPSCFIKINGMSGNEDSSYIEYISSDGKLTNLKFIENNNFTY
jgi:hypothetical protein